MADPFPEDVMYHILSRLPVKSLARFRCVSKLWLKQINDPYLDSIHVKEEPTPILFQPFPHGDEPHKIRVSLLLHGVQKKPVLELDYSGGFFGYLLVGSCKGLSLVCYKQDPCGAGTYGFALINPLSKQRRDLPPLPIDFGPYLIDLQGPCQATGIGFDDSTNTLKTVFYIVKDSDTNLVCTMVHSLGTRSWRETAQTPSYPISGEGVFSHGRLHWLVDRWQTKPKPEEGRQIVWFDVKTEEFGLRDPPKPKEGDRHWIDYNQLVDLNGELGFMCFGPFGIKLWILRLEEWELHCWFNLRSYLPRNGRKYGEYDVEIPGCWNKDGDILVAYNQWERLFVYTLKTGDLRRVADRVDLHQAHIRMHQSSLFFSRLLH